MSTTRGQVLAHIVNELLGAEGDVNHPAWLLVNAAGVMSPSELMLIDSDEMDVLHLKDSHGVVVGLTLGLKKRILVLEFVYWNRNKADQVLTFWQTLSSHETRNLLHWMDIWWLSCAMKFGTYTCVPTQDEISLEEARVKKNCKAGVEPDAMKVNWHSPITSLCGKHSNSNNSPTTLQKNTWRRS